MRKKILAFTAAFVLAPAVLFAGAAPVAAHGIETAHTSCAGGVVGVIEEIEDFKFLQSDGPGRGPSGPVISDLAVAGTLGPGASGAPLLAHDLFCDDVS